MTLPDLLASCARQEGGIQKISTLSNVSYPYFESHSVIALHLLYTENGIEKTEGGWGQAFNANSSPFLQPLGVILQIEGSKS